MPLRMVAMHGHYISAKPSAKGCAKDSGHTPDCIDLDESQQTAIGINRKWVIDIASRHVDRLRPVVEKGLPVIETQPGISQELARQCASGRLTPKSICRAAGISPLSLRDLHPARLALPPLVLALCPDPEAQGSGPFPCDEDLVDSGRGRDPY